ncbi:MAG: Kelch repeat-containing protein, partial [Acidobacteriota bacterium]
GGLGSSGAVSDCDLYDPATNTAAPTGSLATARTFLRATLLANGKVLVSGGVDSSGPVSSAELYDPATGLWSSTGSMSVVRAFHATVLLPNGKVLVAGGDDGANVYSSCELYDPATGTWSSTGSMITPRGGFNIVLMTNGKVMAAGGFPTLSSTGVANCEIYDPATGVWTATGALPATRGNHATTPLANGKVLVSGGIDSSVSPVNTVYLYDPPSAALTATGNLAAARQNPAAFQLADGRVAVVGGVGSSGPLGSTEIYDQSASAWSAGPSFTVARDFLGGVVLMNGRVVIGGGAGLTGFPTQIETIDFTAPAVLSGAGTATGAGGSVSPGGTVTISVTLNNALGVPVLTNYTATLPNGVTPVTGSCSGGSGSCQVTASGPSGSGDQIFLTSEASGMAGLLSGGTVSWTGMIPGGGSVTIQFQVQIGALAAIGTQYCVTVTQGGVAGTQICFTVSGKLATPPGPGTIPLAAGLPNQQRAGSVLIYNLYTSGVNPSTNDTRLTLTNINPTERANVHLFFVDGSSCAVADLFVTLTQNQTLSLQASDFDPGVTGYVVAVVTDENGCPTRQNDLLGGAFVKFDTGHRANLPAVSIAGVGIPACNPNSPTATLAFDGTSYNELPRALALDSLESRATGNSTMLVLNRIGGDLSTGASSLGTMAGLLFDDLEASQSFTLTGGSCQVRGVLGNNYPRTAPRYDVVIPAGRTGWMKLWSVSDAAMTGALINNATIGFSGGHNLHALTTTSTATLTIPVFPAN